MRYEYRSILMRAAVLAAAAVTSTSALADADLDSKISDPNNWAAQAGDPRVTSLSGGKWELTESEYDDGHTRFVMLRGGSDLPPGESEWLPPRGPRPIDSHCKYLLLSEGLDRSGSISFRTVIDLV